MTSRVGLGAALAALCVLVGVCARLSATRVYQADECYNVAMSRLVALGRAESFQTDPNAFDLTLAAQSRPGETAGQSFAGARRALLALFWLNIVLLAACTGESLASRRGAFALLAAATLAPLWTYGIEIRHDNVLLAGLLTMWLVLRVRPGRRSAYFAAGAIVVVLQFVAFKAFAWTFPLCAAFLLSPPPGHRAGRRALGACWAAGAATAFAAARAYYGARGLWGVYVLDWRRMAEQAAAARRFLPFEAFGRFALESPLLLALALAALLAAARELRRRRARAFAWDGELPEAGLFALSLAALLVNPTPYAYNLLNVVPFAFLLVWRRAARAGGLVRPRILALALAGHAAIFAAAVAWESRWTNARQLELMDAAEALTAPTDPVYDGAGLVPTRPSVGYRWLLDSLNIRSFVDGSGPSAREMLAREPAAVFIPNYRTDWLPAPDHAFIRARYLPLSDDFWVLGAALPAGGGSFEVLRAGRYRIAGPDDSALPAGAALDGRPFSGGAAIFSAGAHRLRVAADFLPTAVWVGPRLESPPRLAWRGHRRLFVDWY